jgi:hypothetical protein
MTGWVIQGVRGEGKTLCAVGKAKEYLLRGCPVVTNIDLYLDELLPVDNASLVTRIPDYPRRVDFDNLYPAYDVTYKAEDRNGLLILDEATYFLNSRNWKDKDRQQVLEWLFLSRKLHWDLILLSLDHDSLDKQAKHSLCDYLVQSSRTDRMKIPYVGKVLEFFGFNAFFPKAHLYDVYYGFSFQQAPQEQWRFTGIDLYDAYNTNQLFNDGSELISVESVSLDGTLSYSNKYSDMRAVYSLLPASYLSGFVFFDRLQQKIDDLEFIGEVKWLH